MQLVTNEIDTDNVREETFRGRDYLVTETVPIRAMDLDKGYVPKSEVMKSAKAWNGTPLTLNHPRNEHGDPVSANSPSMAEKTWLGYLFNNESVNDGERTRGEAWFDVETCEENAPEVVERLENGDPLSVSTGYFFDRLPPGVYDGEQREAVAGNIRPDHVAVLPNKEGKCSIDDGCMIGAANSDFALAAHPDDPDEPEAGPMGEDSTDMQAANVLSQARRPEYDGTETASWQDVDRSLSTYADVHDWDDVDSVDDLSGDQRQTIAEHTLLGDPDADSFDELHFFPVVNPSTGDLNEGALDAVLGGRGSQADVPDDALESAREVARNLLEEEFDRDLAENEMTANARFQVGQVVEFEEPHQDEHEHGIVQGVIEAEMGTSFYEIDVYDEDGELLQEGYRWYYSEEMSDGDVDEFLELVEGNDETMLDQFRRIIRNVMPGRPLETFNDAEQQSDEPAESGADEPSDTMGDRTEELVEEYGFNAENLPDEDTECFELIYESFSENEEQTVESEEEEQDDEIEELREEIEALNAKLEEQETAKEEERREELIDEIVENSERERETLESIEDTDALEVIRDETARNVQAAANFAATPGASASSKKSRDMPALTANERLAEREESD